MAKHKKNVNLVWAWLFNINQIFCSLLIQ